MVKTVKVDESNKHDLIRWLRCHLLHNLFVIHNLLYEPDKTTTYVSYADDESLKGFVSIYRDFRVPLIRLDGEKEAADELLKILSENKMLLYCPPSLIERVKVKFPEAKHYLEDQMCVRRNEFRSIDPTPALKLAPIHASQLEKLYSTSHGIFADNKEKCTKLLESLSFYGIVQNSKLVSVAFARQMLPNAWELSGVFTDPDYRCKGYATKVSSAATLEALEYAETVSLYVRHDNAHAVKTYEKLGYRKIDEWYWVDVGTGLAP